MKNTQTIIKKMKAKANPANAAGMARFGINAKNTLGCSMPFLRGYAKEIGRDHALALQLWDTGIHEARILAALIDEPARVTKAQMKSWSKDFDSWDVCDQVCSNLFDKTPDAYITAQQWAKSTQEFVKRAGFVLMACLAVHDKKAPDAAFKPFFPLIIAGAVDERNFVKKAVNWALRQIGKRNAALRRRAIAVAGQILAIPDSASARWVARDALRELR